MGGRPTFQAKENIYFPKLGKDIREAALQIRANLLRRIAERKGRVSAFMDQFALTGEDMLRISNMYEAVTLGRIAATSDAPLDSARPDVKVSHMAALKEDSHLLQEEEAEARRLARIAHHIGAEVSYDLSYHDLVYFEFE